MRWVYPCMHDASSGPHKGLMTLTGRRLMHQDLLTSYAITLRAGCPYRHPSHQARVLAQLNHPYVIKHFDSWIDAKENKLSIVMELASRGNLSQVIKVGRGEVSVIVMELVS